MTTREIRIGQQTLRFETGKLAKQAGGSVIVRFGDSVVLVTACRAANRPRRHRLPAADGRLPRIHLRLGPNPRRLLQARGQARRKGSADEPLHRPADPAAVPRRMAVRDADHRARPVGRSGERHRRPRDHRRVRGARAVGDSVREDDRRRPHRPRRRHLRRQPDLPAAQGEQARSRSSPAARTAW